MKGKVYLVGAGPGDPKLITVKGLECIRKADVLINDYLASPILLKYTPQNAENIYVGKKAGDHTYTQDQINALIIEKARAGLTVVRLKGGDPFLFGRGGEEAEELIKAGIPCEIVPGVTSAVAVPAYAGIPLTHRRCTSTLAIVTGHEDPTKKESKIDWAALATGIGTLVFLMGVKNLPQIARQLIHHGKHPDTPVALTRWGTTPKQKTVTGTLETIAEKVVEAGLTAPATIVVGDVVRFRNTLKWYENQPLMGKTIVVTRARQQASQLMNHLIELGAECVEIPTIKVVPPQDIRPLKASIARIATYDWLVFTSVNGVNYFFEHLFAAGKDARALHHLKTAVVGPATRKRLLGFGINSDIVPKSYQAESVVKAFAGQDLQGKKILLPRAKRARSVIPVELTNMGASVDDVTAYENHPVTDEKESLLTRLKQGSVDMVTFTSSSTVENFYALLPPDALETLMNGVAIASIGPISADTARSLGFTVDIVPDAYTIPDLCEAIRQYYQKD
jgi:uroporphyrinogen III methyltransferase/synthase